jgi:predicted Zn-dependent protease with MMP-like domain
VPVARSRSESFDEVASAAVARLERRLGAEFDRVQFLVEDVPDPATIEEIIPLGRATPGVGGQPARVVLYRRPIETRASGILALRRLVLDVLVEQVAEALGLDPDDLDPDGRDPDGLGPGGRP